MEIAIYNINGKKTTKKANLNDKVFGIEPNDHAIYLDVKQHMANSRQGTSKAKERSDVKGSGRKIKKQKGTGTARFGDIKNPLFRGGGRAFGPRPRDYSFNLNKKVKRLARRSALSYKAKDNEIIILEDFSFDEAKTKHCMKLLDSLNLAYKKNLLVLAKPSENILLSARNIPGTKVLTTSELNTYELMDANNLLLLESSVLEIENQLC